MQHLRVALLQIFPTDSREGNLAAGTEACRQAKAMGADIALFPEMYSCGYQIPDSADALNALTETPDGAFLSAFASLAGDLQMAIAITCLEAHAPLPRNTLFLYDRFGKLALTYAKVHTCDFGDECRLSHGEDFYVADLDTAQGTVKVGAMICYDREFPESARILMLKGAELILVPNACPMEINRLSQLRARAYENMVGIATCNYPYGMPDCNGHSTAFDGIAYRPADTVSRDTLLIEAGEQAGIYLADFPIDEMRRYRETEVHGNAYRRPPAYTALTETAVHPPFCRSDRRD